MNFSLSWTSKDVRHLLLRAREDDPLGSGSHADVYSLPQWTKGMQDYVLRVERGQGVATDLKALLASSTSLVPVKQLVADHALGQPLMQLVGHPEVTVLARQSGKSLYAHRKALSSRGHHAMGKTEATLAIIEQILELPHENGGKNPFVPLFEATYDVAASGRMADWHPGNIMLDTTLHRLSLVDQLSLPKTPPVSIEATLRQQPALFLKLFCPKEERPMLNTPYRERYDQLTTALATMMEQARVKVMTQRKRHPEKPAGLRFENVSEVKAVPLRNAPYQLVEQLRAIEQRGNFRER